MPGLWRVGVRPRSRSQDASLFACICRETHQGSQRQSQSGRYFGADSVCDLIQRSPDPLRRINLLKPAERLGQREQAAAYLVDAPFEESAQQLLLFEAREPYETG